MYNDRNEFDREAPDGTWRDQRHDERRSENRRQAPKDERAPGLQEDEAGAPRHNGRFRKGVCANPYGRAGNPAKRAKERAARTESLEEVFLNQLRRDVTVTEGGRPITLPMYQLIVRKLVHDLMNAPIKVRLELICGRHSWMRDVLERAEEHDESDLVWTDELEDAYKVIAGRYDLDEFAGVAGEDGRSGSYGDDRDRDRDPR
jgi:hypothetical protein